MVASISSVLGNRACRRHCAICLIVLLLVCAALPRPAAASELITNGGFETGSFSGWTVTNVVTNIWFNWSVTSANCSACVNQWTNGTSPHSGNFDAWNGWAAGNPVPDAYRLRQDLTIPNNPGEYVRLVFWDRLQWDLQSYTTPTGSTLPQYRIVNVLNPSNNAVIQELDRFTVPAYSRGPMMLGAGQGWNQHIFNLTAYKGQTIRLEFMCTIAQNTIGPGFCEFDDISVTNFTPTAAEVSVGGRVVTAYGIGISNVFVSMTDSFGVTRTAVTGSLGYYSFSDVPVGQTYTISVSSKRYEFANPVQAITVQNAIDNVDFVASY